MPIVPLHGVMVFPSMMVPIAVKHPDALGLVGTTCGGGLPVTMIYRVRKSVSSPNFGSICRMKIVKGVLHMFRVPNKGAAMVVRSGKPGMRLSDVAGASPCLGKVIAPVPRTGSRLRASRFGTLVSAYGSLADGFVRTSRGVDPSAIFTVGGLSGPRVLMGFVYTGFPVPMRRGVGLLGTNSLRDHLCVLIGVLGHRMRLTSVGRDVRVHAHRSVSHRRHRCFLRRRVGGVRSRLNTKRRSRVSRLHRGKGAGG